jgi:hypothetical protein
MKIIFVLGLFWSLVDALHFHHVQTIRHGNDLAELVETNFIQKLQTKKYTHLKVEYPSKSTTKISYRGRTMGYQYDAVYDICRVDENNFDISFDNSFITNTISLQKLDPNTVQVELNLNTTIPMSKFLIRKIIQMELNSFMKL